MLIHGKRLKSAGFVPASNNSQGIQKDKLKYICYNFKTENEKADVINAKPVIDSFMAKTSGSSGMKLDGVVSSKRVTAIGEWNKFLAQGSMLLFYGSPGILNVLTPKLFVDLQEISSTKCVMLFDKINAKKSVLEKYSSLQPDGEKTPLVEQFINQAALLTLLGIQTIGATQWSVEAEQFPKMLDVFLSGAAQDTYIASTMKSFRDPSVFYKD